MAEAKTAANTNSPLADILPDAIQQSIRDAMTRLENLSQAADKKAAAGALESHGFLTMTLGNIEGGLPDFRRAVALDPTREQSWDMLLGTSPDSEWATLCEARLKAKDSARNHLLFGKMLAKEQKWGLAKAQAEAALKLESDNVAARQLLAALIIRQSTDDESLEPAKTHLEAIQELLAKLPASQEKSDRFREFMLNVILVNALWSYPESISGVRTALGSFLQDFPNDEDAGKIRAALE